MTKEAEVILNYWEVIEDIIEALDISPNILTEVYNSICSDRIEYIGDYTWKMKLP